MQKRARHITLAVMSTLLISVAMGACGESRTPSGNSSSNSSSSSSSSSSSIAPSKKVAEPEKVKLLSDMKISGTTNFVVDWAEVKNAVGYTVTIGEDEFTTEETEYDVTSAVTAGEVCEISVQAHGNGTTYGDSEAVTIESTPIVATPNLGYSKDYWDGYSVSKGASEPTGDIVIPDRYEGLSVVEIKDSAFKDCTQIQSIALSQAIITVGDYAFYNCTNLVELQFPDSVKSVGESVFCFCEALKIVDLGDGLEEIGSTLFSNNPSLTNLHIGKEVGKIVPEYIESSNVALQNVTVSEENLFYQAIDGNLYTKDGKTLVRYTPGKTTTEFVVPNGVEIIGASSFSLCENLKKITLSDTVLKVGQNSFFMCINLEKIKIGMQVNDIQSGAFKALKSLETIIIPRSVENMAAGVFSVAYEYKHYIYCEAEEQPIGWDDGWQSSIVYTHWVYYYSETEPVGTGNYWHYDENGNPKIWE